MMDFPEGDSRRRGEELLADLVCEGLEPDEAAELDHLLGIERESQRWAAELAAAAAALVWIEPEPLPCALRERLERRGDEWSALRRQSTN